MSVSKTAISWTDATWNPVRGCSRVSEGCRNCYAERQAARFSRGIDEIPGPRVGQRSDPFHGFARRIGGEARWTGKVALIPDALDWPLRRKKPLRIFVNSMSDLFHEGLPFEDIARVYNAMAACPQHTFQVLTKRPARRVEFVRWVYDEAKRLRCEPFWPLPNVWEGVSAEDQATLDARVPDLLRCPAAVRFVSLEPQLGPASFRTRVCAGCGGDKEREHSCDCPAGTFCMFRWVRGGFALGEEDSGRPWPIDWVIQGGESGPRARPFDLAWARSVRDQCKAAGVSYFMKQLGARPRGPWGGVREPIAEAYHPASGRDGEWILRDRAGADPEEWPADLRVREFPEVRR